MKYEEEVDVAAANARLASMDLSAPAPTTRKPRADKGVKRGTIKPETFSDESTMKHANMLMLRVLRALEKISAAKKEHETAKTELQSYLDELTSK